MLTSGIPLALSVTALSCAFNYKLSDWCSGASNNDKLIRDKGSRAEDSRAEIRAAEVRRHGYLLATGALCLVPTVIGSTNPLTVFTSGLLKSGAFQIRPTGQMALAGLAYGGAATIVTGVCMEWDHYEDGWKVAITGGSLFALLGGALLM